jgi:hypothetical protein
MSLFFIAGLTVKSEAYPAMNYNLTGRKKSNRVILKPHTTSWHNRLLKSDNNVKIIHEAGHENSLSEQEGIP